MADPNIPNIPFSVSPDQTQFFTAVKTCLEALSGQGRNTDGNRALRISELESLGIDVGQFLRSSKKTPYAIIPSSSGSMDTPNPPKNLTAATGAFVHALNWTNPADEIVSHVEIWAAEASQDRTDAQRIGIFTVTEAIRAGAGLFKHSGFDVTSDFTYWIRSVSYAGKHSVWCPPEIQGGYVVPGEDSVQETVTKLLAVLTGEITESQLYADLSTRIDLIDADSTGLVTRVATLREEVETAETGLLDRLSAVEVDLGSIGDFETNTAYSLNDLVSYESKIYKCIVTTTAPSPLPTDTDYWKKVGESSTLAENLANNAIGIESLDIRVTDNEGGISVSSGKITALESTVNDPTTGVDATATGLSSLDTRVEDTEDGLVSQAGLIDTVYADAKSYADEKALLVYEIDPDEPVNLSTDIDGADAWIFSLEDAMADGALVYIEYEGDGVLDVNFNGEDLTTAKISTTSNYGDVTDAQVFSGEIESTEIIDLSQEIGSGAFNYGGIQ
ncbi:MAG: hypothetical protein HON48_14295 [Desulfobacula sp.]|jgi:hypothetical protein|nr:hypothetical protein [Desulfobacula sp.]